MGADRGVVGANRGGLGQVDEIWGGLGAGRSGLGADRGGLGTVR